MVALSLKIDLIFSSFSKLSITYRDPVSLSPAIMLRIKYGNATDVPIFSRYLQGSGTSSKMLTLLIA
jgi:hypothetical protein